MWVNTFNTPRSTGESPTKNQDSITDLRCELEFLEIFRKIEIEKNVSTGCHYDIYDIVCHFDRIMAFRNIYEWHTYYASSWLLHCSQVATQLILN